MVFESLKTDPQRLLEELELLEEPDLIRDHYICFRWCTLYVKIDFKADFSLTCCICVMGVRGEGVTEVS